MNINNIKNTGWKSKAQRDKLLSVLTKEETDLIDSKTDFKILPYRITNYSGDNKIPDIEWNSFKYEMEKLKILHPNLIFVPDDHPHIFYIKSYSTINCDRRKEYLDNIYSYVNHKLQQKIQDVWFGNSDIRKIKLFKHLHFEKTGRYYSHYFTDEEMLQNIREQIKQHEKLINENENKDLSDDVLNQIGL